MEHTLFICNDGSTWNNRTMRKLNIPRGTEDEGEERNKQKKKKEAEVGKIEGEGDESEEGRKEKRWREGGKRKRE